MAPHSSLRASDADRDAVAERLRLAAVEGRLEPDELEERLHEALRARTYGDLRRLLTDLPSTPMAWERRRVEARPAARIAVAVVMRVLVTLAVVAIVVTVAALMTAWWILWGRRSPSVRLGAPPPWDRSPRPWTRALALEADEARAFRRTPARCSRARTAR
jgi:hypothetical protein